ncbi:MFS transporter [Streptomyces sp. NPDC051173]|uniref:MFS transporter n=1 Tax=Streptomyces sp. NPDC051173 TaxID=3155164 RepID=UPI00344CC81F
MTEQREARRSPWLMLTVLCVGQFMTLLDTTIVNIAIPDMVDGLRASLDQVLWFVNAYMIVFAALQMLAGRLGDRYGPQRMFAAGLVVFTAASAACGMAQSPTQMIVTRVIQGIGAAVMMPQTLTLLTAVFPAERRGAAFGIWSAVAGLAAVAGPTLGGVLVDGLGWRWIFYINVPLGVLAVLATFVFVPDIRLGRKARLDVPGVLLSTAGLFLISFALIEGQRYDWGTITSFIGIPLLGAVGVLLLVLFVLLQRSGQARQPLLPFALFRIRTSAVSGVLGAALMFGSVGVLLPLTIYVQSALGLSAVQAGLAIAPAPLVTLFVAPLTGKLLARFGGRVLVCLGFLAFAAGIALMAALAGPDSSRWVLLPGLLVFGVGMGLAFGPVSTLAVRNVPPALLGAASGVFTTLRQVGTVLGAAVIGAMLQARLAHELVSESARRAAELPAQLRPGFEEGFHQAADKGIEVGTRGTDSMQGLLTDVPERLRGQVGGLAGEVFGHSLTSAVQAGLLLAAGVLAAAALLALLLPGRDLAAGGGGTAAPETASLEQPVEG